MRIDRRVDHIYSHTDWDAIWDISAFTLLWLGLEVLINPLGDFAANDDWVYGHAVQAILRDGSFSLPSGASANVILQAYWGALFSLPFGFTYTALRMSTLVLGLLGIFSVYGIAREVGGSRFVAVVAALSIALNPLYLGLANTFMTDVPLVSLTALAFWLFIRGIRSTDNHSLFAAFVIAIAAVMIRQFAIIFVMGLGAALVVRSRFSRSSVFAAVAAIAIAVATHVLFQHWLVSTRRTPNITALRPLMWAPNGALIKGSLQNALKLLPYIGLMLSPIYFATGFASVRRLMQRNHWLITGVIIALVLAQVAVAVFLPHRMPEYGNILSSNGLGPLTLRDTFILHLNVPAPPRFSSAFWLLALSIGIAVGTAVVVHIAVATGRLVVAIYRRNSLETHWIDSAVLVIVFLYGSIVLLLSVRVAAFDRYLLMFVPPLILLAVAGTEDRWVPRLSHMIAAGVVLACFGLFAIPATHDYLAWQRARLAATNALEAAGVPRRQIDGGYEYNGRAAYWLVPERKHWGIADDRYVIASGPVPGYTLYARYPYTRWLTMTQSNVVVLQRSVDSSSGSTRASLIKN